MMLLEYNTLQIVLFSPGDPWPHQFARFGGFFFYMPIGEQRYGIFCDRIEDGWILMKQTVDQILCEKC